MGKIFWVDLPDPSRLNATTVPLGDSDDATWVNVGKFASKEEAIAWIRVNIGPCDDEGRLVLIIEGEEP